MAKFNEKCNLLAIISSICILAIGFICVSCAKREEKINQISVRLKWIPNAAFSGDIIAKEKGFFKENNIEATIHQGAFDLDPIKLIASGSDDFGIAGSDQIILARAKGIPLVSIGVIFQSSPVAFVTKEDSGITEPSQFIGKKVGVKTGTDADTIYTVLMKRLKIDRAQIKEIPVKFSLTPFLTGQIDVHPTYATNEPLQLEKMGVKVNIIDPKEYGVKPYGMCYFTTEKMIQQNPELVQRYLRSVIKGYEWAMDNKEEATKTIVQFNKKLNYETQLKMMKIIEPILKRDETKRICWMNKDKWLETEKVYLDAGILKKPIDIDQAFTMRFVKKVYSVK